MFSMLFHARAGPTPEHRPRGGILQLTTPTDHKGTGANFARWAKFLLSGDLGGISAREDGLGRC